MKEKKHGTLSAYQSGCSCEDCRRAAASHQRERRAKDATRRDEMQPKWEHGLRKTYQYGCRCDACRQAEREYSQQRRNLDPEIRLQERARAEKHRSERREHYLEKQREAARRYRERNPEHVRALNRGLQERWRLRQRKITAEEKALLLTAQAGVCAICKGNDADGKQLGIDHCHTTKAVRGLLCRKCNMALGCMDDDPDRLRAAAVYLEKYKGV